MQRTLMLLLTFLIIFNMSFSCYADSFKDHCSSMEEFPYRKVYNLNAANDYLANLNFPLQDRTALEITDYSDYGEIIYEVNQVEEVTFSIYRKYPSFAVKFLGDDDNDDDNLVYGIVASAETYSIPIPLFMDESDDSLYCEDDDKWYLLTSDMAFEEVQCPSNPLIPYGAEVQVSNDGQTYDNIPLEMSEPKSLSDEYYLYEETFHAYLPEDTTHVKIRIKQVPTLRDRLSPGNESQPTYTSINVEHTAMIRTIAFIGPKSEFNPEENPDKKPNVMPQTIIINPISKDENAGKPSKKQPATSAGKSSSTSSGSSRSGNTTTSETTTSDSNNTTNTTTNYTSNYYFINLGEENTEAIKQALAKIGVEVEKPTESGEISEEKQEEVIRVLYDDSLTIGSSGEGSNEQTPSTPPDTANQDHKILYLLAGGILASILIQIFHFLRQPTKSENESPKVDFDDNQDTEDNRF